MKDKLETILLILGAISLLGMLIGIFTGWGLYFGFLWIFVLGAYGLIFGSTLSILFVFSKGIFARIWGMIYLSILGLFLYVFYLALQYEKPTTLMEYLFGTDVKNELLQLSGYIEFIVLALIVFAIFEVVVNKLNSNIENKKESNSE